MKSFSTGTALLLAMALIMPVPAGAGSTVIITEESPFASCDVSSETGTNYLDAEVEPWIDVNPANSQKLIAGWQQDRWSNGGSRSLLSSYSTDGGASWTPVVVPGINKCSGGRGEFAYDRSTDPWVATSPNGVAYFMSLSFFNDRPDGGVGANAMLVSRSTDGGASWGNPKVLKRDTDGRAFNDKNAITADPSDSRFVYATWDRLFDTTLPKVAARLRAEGQQLDGVSLARERYRAIVRGDANPRARAAYYTGPTYFVRTRNGGKSWDEARVIHDPGRNGQTIGNQVVVEPDGSVLVFFTNIKSTGETSISFVRSNDRGATFARRTEAIITDLTATGVLTPDSRDPVRDGNLLFDVAIDRDNGNLYLVWQDARQQGVDKVAFAMSTNGGLSWSKPAFISQTPRQTSKYRNQSFTPSVEVGPNHKLFVTYYDFRNDPAGSAAQELTDYWIISCNPAAADCRSANGWGDEKRLTPASFNMLWAPNAKGYFVGDYQGLVRQGNGVRALFGITVGPGLTDMATTRVR